MIFIVTKRAKTNRNASPSLTERECSSGQHNTPSAKKLQRTDKLKRCHIFKTRNTKILSVQDCEQK